MKLLAQSLILVNPAPYTHLGYGSAYGPTTELPYSGTVAMTGYIVFLLGLVLYPLLRWRRWRWFPISGLLVGTLLALASSYIKVPPYYPDPVGTTKAHIMSLYDTMVFDLADGKSIPKTLRELKHDYDGNDVYVDGWMHPLRLITRSKHGLDYAVASDGRDGRPGTADDIISPWTSEAIVNGMRIGEIHP